MLEQRYCHERLPVSRWAREPATNQINALDALGGVVMTLTAGPNFAPRLAAAFHTTRDTHPRYSTLGLRPPAFPP
ncbi:hypothetical protein NYO99_11850 [Pelomonas sp. UHG3]|uniref:Uncharacterized protein n=1 Tax=Roseateles hydrophilus TaxID=2975054 RepID=A0ACC6CBA4_9BURK|nr:hypothetical protein [Pelomonas sp. UHG3]MCY4745668.1 hypothetical protein [Pelomonas sp. UHG3]